MSDNSNGEAEAAAAGQAAATSEAEQLVQADEVEEINARLGALEESLTELAETGWVQALSNLPGQREAIENAQQAVTELNERLQQIVEHTEELVNERQTATGTVDSAGTGLVADFHEWQDELSQADTRLVDRAEQFANDVQQLTASVEEMLGEAKRSLQEKLGEKHSQLVVDVTHMLQSTTSDVSEHMEQAARTLSGRATADLNSLRARLRDELGDRVEREAKNQLTEQTERMSEEVANNLVLGQASVAITSAISPVLPQLVALRAAVGVIKQALALLP